MKDFIPYELALKLKELGFDEPCFAFFNGRHHDWMISDNNGTSYLTIDMNKDIGDCVKRPLFSQVFRWFREKHNIDGLVYKITEGHYYYWITECEYENYNHYKYKKYNTPMKYFKTYEEPEVLCLEKLIEIVEQKLTNI